MEHTAVLAAFSYENSLLLTVYNSESISPKRGCFSARTHWTGTRGSISGTTRSGRSDNFDPYFGVGFG